MMNRALKILALAVTSLSFNSLGAQQTPDVGHHAPNFALASPDGSKYLLLNAEKKGRVVLVVLRGYPGYQCPFCVKQVHDFAENAAAFAKAGASVVLIYPGPPANLDEHAKDFIARTNTLPAGITLVTDPDYMFTNLYGLRWEKEHETAYPATFVINREGYVQYRKVSDGHGDRTTAAEVLAELASHPAK